MKLPEDEVLRKLGENIAAIRNGKNFSLRELSEKCAVHFSDIGKIEKGKKNISVLTLVDLANGLGVHPKKLMDFEMGV